MSKAGNRLHEFPKPIMIYDETHDLDDDVVCRFDGIPKNIGVLNGHIHRLDVIIEGSLQQTGSDTFTMEDIWSLVHDFKVSWNGGSSGDPITGNTVMLAAWFDRLFNAGNDTVDYELADLTGTDAVDIAHRWPYQLDRLSTAICGEKGKVEFKLRDPGVGDWAVESGEELNVQIIAWVSYSPDLFVPRPRMWEMQDTSAATYKSDAVACKPDLVMVFDDTDTPGAYSRGTTDVNVYLDSPDNTLWEKFTATEIAQVQDWNLPFVLDTEFPNGVAPVIVPPENEFDLTKMAYGEKLFMNGFRNGTGITRYAVRKCVNPDDKQLSIWGGAHNIDVNAEGFKSHLRIAANREGINSGPNANLTSHQKACLQRLYVG